MRVPESSDPPGGSEPPASESATQRPTRTWEYGALTVVVGAVVLLGYYRYVSNTLEFLDSPRSDKLSETTVAHLRVMLLVAVGVLALLPLYGVIALLGSRWRRLRVFIGYSHIHEAVVPRIASSLVMHGLRVDFLPMGAPAHDAVISRVQGALSESDVLLTLPGVERSFVDAEILTASALGKPIVFLRVGTESTLPDTAFEGYPVFNLDRLEPLRFRPLARFLEYACHHRRDVLRDVHRVWVGFWFFLSAFGMVYMALGVVGELVGIALGLISFEVKLRAVLIAHWVAFVVVVVGFVASVLVSAALKVRAMRVARQAMLTGRVTYKKLAEGLSGSVSDQEILRVLEPGPLMLRHAAPPGPPDRQSA